MPVMCLNKAVNNLPINYRFFRPIYRFALPVNDRNSCRPATLDWQPNVTHCDSEPKLEDPIKDPARFPWHEVKKVEHYRLDVNAMTQPMTLKEDAGWNGGA